MSQALYEQYKEALRRGHVASLRGRLDVAEAAYRTAAAIAPDRALPFVSLAGVLRRRDQLDEALAAFDSALARAPGDEGALRGRADLHADAGRRAAAASDLDALSLVLERAGRLGDALEAAARALDLAESRSRRRDVDRLRAVAGRAEGRAETDAESPPEPSGARASGGTPPADDGVVVPGDRIVVEGESTAALPGRPAPAPPPDPAVLRAVADVLLDSGDLAEATERYLALAVHYRSAGRYDAAMDACLALLAASPSNHRLQLEIAAIQADRGWLDTAGEKVRLLARLADLDEDGDARAAVEAFAAERGLGPTGGPAQGG
jgi:tetratricopeptide (TPR) repeat protein